MPAVAQVRRISAGGVIAQVWFVGDTAAFVLGEGALLLVPPDGTDGAERRVTPHSGAERRVTPHDGAILSSCAHATGLITGGDDGRIVETAADGSSRIIAADARGQWIDCVAAARSGAVAWSAGKEAFLRSPDGTIRSIDLPSTAGGLAFPRDERYLAIAHYNGVTLWPRDGGAPEELVCKGMHTGIAINPAGDFVVTRMRDPALQGWCLRERSEHAMPGYAAPVRAIDCSADGNWLASSGSQYLVLWPIRQAQNPLTGVPILLAGYRAVATAVACHPQHDAVAVGYADGTVLLVRIRDEAEILLKNRGDAPVGSLAWNAAGNRFAIGCEDGSGRVMDLTVG